MKRRVLPECATECDVHGCVMAGKPPAKPIFLLPRQLPGGIPVTTDWLRRFTALAKLRRPVFWGRPTIGNRSRR